MRNPRARIPSTVIGSALALATSVALLPGAATASAAAGSPGARDHPLSASALARSVGIEQPGEAFMGWSTRSSATGGVTGPAGRAPSGAASPAGLASGVLGIDVSSHQGNVPWSAYWAQGRRFAYVKATEGTTYHNPYYAEQYRGSSQVGMIRGAYHFALPNVSSGASQAAYFATHGGGWSPGGRTLPGVLDIEYNPYGSTCYAKSPAAMVSWIRSFTTEYKRRTGRDAVIYSTTDWWRRCTGDSPAFGATNPLWIARYASSPGTLPAGWLYRTFWQYSAATIDQDAFNGTYARLRALALG